MRHTAVTHHMQGALVHLDLWFVSFGGLEAFYYGTKLRGQILRPEPPVPSAAPEEPHVGASGLFYIVLSAHNHKELPQQRRITRMQRCSSEPNYSGDMRSSSLLPQLPPLANVKKPKKSNNRKTF